MFSGSKQMKKMYLLILILLQFGCKAPDDIQLRLVVLLLQNNSSETARILGYKDDCPETVFKELQIFPDQVIEVGVIPYSTGFIYESGRLDVYKGDTLIYDVEDPGNRGYYRIFEDAVEQKMEDYYIRVAPLFKWCGNELCEEQ
jgi:hypothetical protein